MHQPEDHAAVAELARPLIGFISLTATARFLWRINRASTRLTAPLAARAVAMLQEPLRSEYELDCELDHRPMNAEIKFFGAVSAALHHKRPLPGRSHRFEPCRAHR